MRSGLSYCIKPGPIRASVFAGGWKGGIGLCPVEGRSFGLLGV